VVAAQACSPPPAHGFALTAPFRRVVVPDNEYTNEDPIPSIRNQTDCAAVANDVVVRFLRCNGGGQGGGGGRVGQRDSPPQRQRQPAPPRPPPTARTYTDPARTLGSAPVPSSRRYTASGQRNHQHMPSGWDGQSMRDCLWQNIDVRMNPACRRISRRHLRRVDTAELLRTIVPSQSR
jgi:hypothetical protein